MKEIKDISQENNAGLEMNDGIRFGDVKLKTGVRIHYAERGNKSGQPVILLHGYTDSSFSYSLALPLLNEKYNVFALDQRGHGDSDRPKSGYELADFAADVVAFLDSKGLRKAIIVGHSMGSHIAQRIAIAAPERVEKLILIGSASTLRLDAVLELRDAINGSDDTIPYEFVREFQYSTVFRNLPEEFMNQVIAESMKLPKRVWQSAIDGFLSTDSKSELDKIKSPTLIMWGEKDEYFLRDEQDKLLAAIPDSRLRIYEDIGHSPHWECPLEFVSDLEGFIAQE